MRIDLAKKIVVYLAGIAVLVAALGIFLAGFNDKEGEAHLRVGGVLFSIEIADSEKERMQGLSGRDYLCEECAMLFIFPEKGEYYFHMKDMEFPLDFIWILDKKVAEISSNISEDFGGLIYPEGQFDAVLEIHAGKAKSAGIKEGDIVEFL